MVRVHHAPMASSPPSSTEATHFGTPSTNITAMSPDACPTPRSNLRVNTNQARSATRAYVPRSIRLSSIHNAQLSPMAEEFTPQTVNFPSSRRFSPVRSLVVGSMPDYQVTSQPVVHGAIGQGSGMTTVDNMSTEIPLSPSLSVVMGTFSTDENVTRTFQIYDKNIPSLYHILHQFPIRFDSLAYIDSRHIESGIIRLNFHDDRDAKQAYVLATSLTHPHCEITQLTIKDVATAHGMDPNTVTNYEGQLLVTIMYNGRSVMPTLPQFHEKLAVFGDVKAVARSQAVINNAVTYRVEYHNIEEAKEAAKYLPQASYQNVQYLVAPYEPDIHVITPYNTPPATTFNQSLGQPSITGRSTLGTNDYARLGNVMARVMREPTSPRRGAARMGHNVVDIGRIEAGLDVRTTIMLRNIPNKVDQETLKNLLDVTSFGQFDFMYLRIDFANDCNVGYAFINFVDPLAIIPFARARAGRRWNIFSSDKVAEISYATIQGRDCLTQKFRNSSVMLEDPSYRPQLYHVHPSPFAGQEEPFPDPDNYSKMKRSVDNAEHVGLYRQTQQRRHHRRANARHRMHNSSQSFNSSPTLSWSSSITSSSVHSGLFAPREGQAHREEQRRRRSQFDRGTPGAEIELSSYRLTDAALEGPRAGPSAAHHPRSTDGDSRTAAHIAAMLTGLRF